MSGRRLQNNHVVREATPYADTKRPPLRGRAKETSPNFGDIEDECTANRDNEGVSIGKPLIASGNRFGEAIYTQQDADSSFALSQTTQFLQGQSDMPAPKTLTQSVLSSVG
jgi:hypothetical protein